MCGIAGGAWRRQPSDVRTHVDAALERLRHRGPNDSGCEIIATPSGTVALGQTRLSIIDLSSGGHQPMASADGLFSIVFNGEIYNYRELRTELCAAGHPFRSESDTEVLLAAWMAWGADCLPRLEGMFAFVVYDRQRHRLTCVRDAFGIKPLFYEHAGESLLFASEQAALNALRGKPRGPDLQRAYDYLVHGDYDSEEHTFVEGVRHLLPGTLLEVDLSQPASAVPRAWWRPRTAQGFHGSYGSAVEATRELFLRNVRLHLRSDVEVGATLSGGIDSSAVVCAIRHLEPSRPIQTFSYVARQSSASEEKWVDIVNHVIGAVSHKVDPTADELFRGLDALIDAQGEPFGSTSIYAQYRVFQLARERGVTVILDGQGADELLAGYQGYPGRRMLSLLEAGQYTNLFRFSSQWGKWRGISAAHAWLYFGQAVLPETVQRGARELTGRKSFPKWLRLERFQCAGVQFRERRAPRAPQAYGRRVTEQLAYNLYGRGLSHLLRHEDRNAMAFSVENRVPFLTLPLAELLLSMPEDYLIAPTGETKSVFRAAMRGIVPDVILDRRDKLGFATPEADWLRRPGVRDWLASAEVVPFLNGPELLKLFDRSTPEKPETTRLVWRWINYIRWYQLAALNGGSRAARAG